MKARKAEAKRKKAAAAKRRKARSKSSSSRRSSPSRSRSFSRGGRRSDVNYKMDITPYNNGLETILALDGVYYYWQPMDNYEAVVGGGSFDNSRQVGFIAQDVEVVIPEIVNTDEHGKVVNYDLLVPVLVEAIQEQQAQLDSLKEVLSNK